MISNENNLNSDEFTSNIFYRIWIFLCLIYPLTILISIAATNIILGPIILGAIFFRRTISESALKIFYLLVLAYLVWTLAAVILSPYSQEWHSWAEERSVFLAIIPGLVIGAEMNRIFKSFRYVIYYLIIIAVYASIQHYTDINWVDGKPLHIVENQFRAQGLQNNALTFAGMIALSLPVTLAIWRRKIVPSLVLVVAGAFCILASMSRAMLLGFIGGGIIIALFGRGKYRLYGILLIALMVILPETLYHSSGERLGEKDETRLYTYKSAIEIIKHHPVTGVGENNWRPAFARYGLDYDKTKNWPPTHAHSDILTCTIENGLIGTTIFVAMWGYIMVVLLVAILKSKEDRRAILTGIFTSLAIILFAGLTQNYQTDAENALLLWFVVGMGIRFAKTTRET